LTFSLRKLWTESKFILFHWMFLSILLRIVLIWSVKRLCSAIPSKNELNFEII
jgi:flagellar biogenesis protein FliO